ncbi:MAG: VWBp37 [Streptosporangiaceae bacterium]|nr:VWBp37 [Streptosporangiaceae bacterium]
MDLSVKLDSISRDDQSWLGSARGTSQAQSIALVIAAFIAGTHYPNGYFPSGLPLAKISSGTNAGQYGPAGTRTVADGATTSGSTALTSATAAFTQGDVGGAVSGTGIPAGTTIASVTNATTAVMSANATATATGVSVTILDALAGFLLTAVPTPRGSGATIVNGALLDVGRIVTANLPIAVPAAVQSTNPRFVFV